MSFNNTYNRFKLVSSLSDEEASKWVPLLKESSEYVYSHVIKENLTDSDCIRLDNAAGVYAYYRYIVYSFRAENSFSAGDVTVSLNTDMVNEAKIMWETEELGLDDLISSSSFIFKRVK